MFAAVVSYNMGPVLETDTFVCAFGIPDSIKGLRHYLYGNFAECQYYIRIELFPFHITNQRKHYMCCAIISLRRGNFQSAMARIQNDFYYTESRHNFKIKF